MVALSVSMSAMTSPALTLSPAATFHSAMLPWVIVGDSAGIVISWYGGSVRVKGGVGVSEIQKSTKRKASGDTSWKYLRGTRAAGPSRRGRTPGSRVPTGITVRIEGTHSQPRRRTTARVATRPRAPRLSGRTARLKSSLLLPARGRFRPRGTRRAVRRASRSRTPPWRPP